MLSPLAHCHHQAMFLARKSFSSVASKKGPSVVVELFYDIISPYSYVQFELLTRQKAQWTSMALRCTPALLGGVLKGADNPAPVQVPAKRENLFRDMNRLCAFHKIPNYRMYPNFPQFAFKLGQLKVQRLLTALQPNLDEPAYEALIRAYFSALFSPNSVDISNVDIIRQIATETGVDGTLIEKAIEASGSEETKGKLAANTKRIVDDYGGFGLPSTVLHLPSGPQMIFGSDRLHIIGQLLGEEKAPLLQ